ncbi:MAG TPA: sulfotransferase [Acidimicrobiales bacterium]
MLRVVGAGVGRTGTHSLKIALEQLLGGPCHHMVEVFAHPEEVAVWTDAIDGKAIDWGALMSGYTAQVDWPGGSFWPELSAANPDAVVLLSTRDPDKWFTSCSNTIFAGIRAMVDGGDEWMSAVMRLFKERFSDEIEDRDAMVAAYERHNEAVRAAVPEGRLLDWTPSDGWEPICERLNLPVPSEPFPVTNTTAEFREMLGMPPLEG